MSKPFDVRVFGWREDTATEAFDPLHDIDTSKLVCRNGKYARAALKDCLLRGSGPDEAFFDGRDCVMVSLIPTGCIGALMFLRGEPDWVYGMPFGTYFDLAKACVQGRVLIRRIWSFQGILSFIGSFFR